MRVAIYARYSTQNQDARSIEDQTRRCRAYAAAHDHEVVAEHHDSATSGSHLDRAGMRRLLEAASGNRPPFAAVLVDDLSRLSRDLGDTWRLVFGDLAGAGIVVVDCSTGLSSDAAGARLTIGALALVNDSYIQMIRHETHRGLEGRALAGFSVGGRTYGYRTVEEENPPDREHPRKVPVIDAAEASIVRRVFAAYVAGAGYAAIAAGLNEDGIAAPHDGGRRLRRVHLGDRGRDQG